MSGADGLHATVRLLGEGAGGSRPGGWLAVEVDCTRARECGGTGRRLGWMDVAVHVDLFGRERYLLARRSDTIVIWDKAQELGRLDRPVPGVPGAAARGDLLREDKETVAKLDQIQTPRAAGGPGGRPGADARPGHRGGVRELRSATSRSARPGRRTSWPASNFEKLMAKVNQQISEGMEKGATSSIITLG